MSRTTCLVLAACAAIGACRSSTDPNELTVTVAVDRVTVDPSSPVGITVTVVNRGLHNIRTSDPHSYACSRAFVILNAANQAVPLPGRVCTLIAYALIDLAPGDSVTIRDSWAADRSDGAENAPVTPGEYRIVARVFGEGQVVESTPVEVSVIAR